MLAISISRWTEYLWHWFTGVALGGQSFRLSHNISIDSYIGRLEILNE